MGSESAITPSKSKITAFSMAKAELPKIVGPITSRNGAPGVTRTPGTEIRNLVLYPPELRGQQFCDIILVVHSTTAERVSTITPGKSELKAA